MKFRKAMLTMGLSVVAMAVVANGYVDLIRQVVDWG